MSTRTAIIIMGWIAFGMGFGIGFTTGWLLT